MMWVVSFTRIMISRWGVPVAKIINLDRNLANALLRSSLLSEMQSCSFRCSLFFVAHTSLHFLWMLSHICCMRIIGFLSEDVLYLLGFCQLFLICCCWPPALFLWNTILHAFIFSWRWNKSSQLDFDLFYVVLQDGRPSYVIHYISIIDGFYAHENWLNCWHIGLNMSLGTFLCFPSFYKNNFTMTVSMSLK